VTVLIASIITVAAMVGQDTFATSLVIAESRNLAQWPGLFDAANDYASRIGGAVTAASTVKHGLGSWETQLLLALTAATSYFTTNRVTGLASRLLPKARA
jgi:hypothetical protein